MAYLIQELKEVLLVLGLLLVDPVLGVLPFQLLELRGLVVVLVLRAQVKVVVLNVRSE